MRAGFVSGLPHSGENQNQSYYFLSFAADWEKIWVCGEEKQRLAWQKGILTRGEISWDLTRFPSPPRRLTPIDPRFDLGQYNSCIKQECVTLGMIHIYCRACTNNAGVITFNIVRELTFKVHLHWEKAGAKAKRVKEKMANIKEIFRFRLFWTKRKVHSHWAKKRLKFGQQPRIKVYLHRRETNTKAMSISDGFWWNLKRCSHWVVTKIKRYFRVHVAWSEKGQFWKTATISKRRHFHVQWCE